MQSLVTPPAEPPREPGAPGYETRDVNPKVILGLVGAIALIVVGSMFGLRQLLNSYSATATRNQPRALPVDQTPPEPHLQNTPVRDYQAFVAEQEEQLNSYGWVDREEGVVRIPIERAMDLAVEKGLTFPRDTEETSSAKPPEPKQD